MNSQEAFKNQLLALGFAALLALLLAGCGRANTIYADPDKSAGSNQTDGSQDDSPIEIDDGAKLPEGFVDQSFNDAEVTIQNSGDSTSTLRLSVNSKTASRAILGITKFDNLALEDFEGVEVALKDSRALRLSLLIDLDCDSASAPRTLNADWVSSSATLGDSIWSVSGDEIENNSGETIVPSTSGTDRTSLDELLIEYPKACLRNGKSDDDELPKFSLGAILLSLGNSSETDGTDSVEIQTLKVQNETYKKWGSK